VPAGWADEQALGLVVNWPTALAALKPLGRIAAGQTVLIHAAAGGTGQAAVKMAKHDGATVIARPRQASTRWYGRSAPTTSSTPAAPTSPPRSCD
jgi:NADPH:quinone reductase-like Zn-dependent oxidoreductase